MVGDVDFLLKARYTHLSVRENTNGWMEVLGAWFCSCTWGSVSHCWNSQQLSLQGAGTPNAPGCELCWVQWNAPYLHCFLHVGQSTEGEVSGHVGEGFRTEQVHSHSPSFSRLPVARWLLGVLWPTEREGDVCMIFSCWILLVFSFYNASQCLLNDFNKIFILGQRANWCTH